MSDAKQQIPYAVLGRKLRQLREKSRETVAEVSGAVEIDEPELLGFETGAARPSEDILLLLISHFGLEEDAAEELWKLAGYTHAHDDHDHVQHEREELKQRTATMMVMLDPRVMYSDSVEVVSNKQGVIVNFSQTASPDSPHLTIARVGMSYDQAKAVMGILHQVLYNNENPGSARRLSKGGTS